MASVRSPPAFLPHVEAPRAGRDRVRARRHPCAVLRAVEPAMAASACAGCALCRRVSCAGLAPGGVAGLRLRAGLVRRRRVMGVHQHACVRLDACRAGGACHRRVLRVPRALSGPRAGNRARLRRATSCASGADASGHLDAVRVAAWDAAYRLSMACQRVRAYRWTAGGICAPRRGLRRDPRRRADRGRAGAADRCRWQYAASGATSGVPACW